MKTTIVKWGNSQGIRLPKLLLESVNLTEEDTVDVLVENNAIVIKKTQQKSHKKLRDRLEEYYGKDFNTIIAEQNQDYKPAEIDWGSSVGEEIW